MSVATTHQKLVELSNKVQRFDVRRLERTDHLPAALDDCIGLAKEAVAIFEALVEDATGESGEASPSKGETSGFDAVSTPRTQTLPHDSLNHVTHLARMEVTRVLERLAARTSLSPDYLVFQGSSLYRKVWRGTSVVEEAVARARGVEAQPTSFNDLATSLRVRKVYAWFRRGVNTEAQPRKEDVQKILRRAGTRIAALVGKPEYGELRSDDRILFMRLQERILRWLGLSPPSFEEGRRLWEDLRSMVDILRQVNLRAELIAHDASLARSLLRDLAAGGETSAINAEVFGQLLRLEGLDEELDKHFAADEVPERATVERVLVRADAVARSRGL